MASAYVLNSKRYLSFLLSAVGSCFWMCCVWGRGAQKIKGGVPSALSPEQSVRASNLVSLLCVHALVCISPKYRTAAIVIFELAIRPKQIVKQSFSFC